MNKSKKKNTHKQQLNIFEKIYVPVIYNSKGNVKYVAIIRRH